MKSKKFDLLLTFGFGLLLFLLIIISYIGVTSLIATNNIFEKTYNISLKSEKEAQEAYANLIAVHRGMKDVALSKNDKQLKIAIDDVNNYDNKILANFNAIIGIQGNDKILTDVLNAYLDWKPIRIQTISFREKGELGRAAENTRTVGATQVILITKKMNLLLEKFRKNTENSFNNSEKIANDSIAFLLLLAIFVILLGIFISVVISRKLLKYRNELHDEKELNRITIDSIGDGVITVDMDRRIVNINKVAQQFTGWDFKKALNKPFTEVFHITNAETGAKAKDPVEDVISKEAVCELENHTILTSVDGVKRHIADSAAPIKDLSNNIIGVVMVFRDVTEQKKHLEEIKYLIYHDGLTGLFNRNYFNKELLRVDDDKYLPLSLIMGDVNGLKLSNDIYGHDIGDALLIRISEILTNNCREYDILSRLGGDEFSIILPNTSNEEANDILEKIKTACQLCEFTPLDFKPIVLSISLGCSTRTSMDNSIDYILKDAEDRMYTHKLLEGKSVRSTIISSLRNTLRKKL